MAPRGWFEEGQSFAGRRGNSQDGLAGAAQDRFADHRVKERVSDQTFGGGYEIVGPPGPERRLPRFHPHAELRPIAERLRQSEHLNLGHDDATQALETALDGRHLAGNLLILGQVLPITPPASECHLRTRWPTPSSTLHDDVDDAAASEPLLLFDQFDVEHVVDGCAGHEDDPPVVESSDSIAADGEIVNGYAEGIGARLRPARATARKRSPEVQERAALAWSIVSANSAWRPRPTAASKLPAPMRLRSRANGGSEKAWYCGGIAGWAITNERTSVAPSSSPRSARRVPTPTSAYRANVRMPDCSAPSSAAENRPDADSVWPRRSSAKPTRHRDALTPSDD